MFCLHSLVILAFLAPLAYSCIGRNRIIRGEEPMVITKPIRELSKKELAKGLQLLCERVECNFSDGLCNYHTSGERAVEIFNPYRNAYRLPPTLQRRLARQVKYVLPHQLISRSWTISDTIFGNKNTGVRNPDQGQYAAAYLYEGEQAVMHVPIGFVLPSEVVVSYNGWEATVGIRLRMCCEMGAGVKHCPSQSTSEADPDVRSWFNYAATCPAGTQKILFTCENLGHNQGACGIDGIHLLRPSSPEIAEPTPFCHHFVKSKEAGNLLSNIIPDSPFGDLDYEFDYGQ